ncbi:MAG: molybdenum cofactor synthesis domain-containing protein [Promethearchaeota archaeon CR_4]|nr:MAG: molybdenum cofactor synthesis domain-containing protein [Candidatus Lokiarchaeota archaeon CR_4]
MKYLKALSFEEFRSKILSGHNALSDVEIIPVPNARGRVLGSSIQSSINVPHFRRSMRDGYAVRTMDTFGATEEHPLIFDCEEEVPAGNVPTKVLDERQCSYVATGSMLPENADGVVMIEFTEMDGSRIKIKQAITPDTFIIPAGKDIRAGEDILPVGIFLTSERLGVLSAIGMKEVRVFRKPRAGVISTGNEVIPSGSAMQPGKIYDINTVTLMNHLEAAGAIVTNYGIIPDNKERLTRVVEEAIATQDIVILSGGTSKGKEDLMPQILETTSTVDIVLHGVRIKPGKPILYARWSGKPVFVLPGYPTSCVMTYLLFVESLVLKIGHYPPRKERVEEARLASRVYSELGRQEFKTVQLQEDKVTGHLIAIPTEKGSESITTLAKADGFLIINEMQTIVEEGEIVKVHLFQ